MKTGLSLSRIISRMIKWMNMTEELSGEWVIMKNDEIIERHLEMKVILELAKKYEGQDIVISKIPSAPYCFYWF